MAGVVGCAGSHDALISFAREKRAELRERLDEITRRLDAIEQRR
jgi:hypothetical protein